MLAALLTLALAPAHAAPSCRERLVTALSSSTLSGLSPCFADGASWTDEAGASTAPMAVVQGLGRLTRRARAESPAWTALSTGTALLTGFGDVAYPWPGHLLVALDGPEAGPWTAGRVYRGARPWPEPVPGPRSWTRGGPEADAAFNETMGAGNPDAWVDRWTPDGEFVSVVGPYKGPEVRTFFRRQTERYARVRTETRREHARRADGSLVFEGELIGKCRGSGAEFDFPYVMAVRASSGVVSFVYEAFSSLSDGCGPFWTVPR